MNLTTTRMQVPIEFESNNVSYFLFLSYILFYINSLHFNISFWTSQLFSNRYFINSFLLDHKFISTFKWLGSALNCVIPEEKKCLRANSIHGLET